MKQIPMVRCPQCQRDFVDQLNKKHGYVFPVHVLNPATERGERYVECPGSLTPITVDHRRAA